MKRDNNIVPLSRDHHFGLLFCWKIRQGLKLNVDAERIKLYVLYFWKNHLNRHFYEEENILFILKGDELCLRAMQEHRRIEKLIRDIGSSGASENLLHTLADFVEHHIRYEERELFPYLERALTGQQLTSIGMQLRELHENVTTDDYEDSFWITKKG